MAAESGSPSIVIRMKGSFGVGRIVTRGPVRDVMKDGQLERLRMLV